MSALKLCPSCSTEYPATERFCPKDGTALRSQTTEVANLVGSVIAERYHVLSKLGEGGMGQVYLAEHVKMGRQSAVKVMHPATVHDNATIARFNREAANASRIDHPHVAGIYDFGETPDGLVYLAMQYVEGPTLTAIMQSNRALPPRRAAELTRQVAEGLHAAHALGIVHRDLKPDNIMVTVDRDGVECVKVVDFGIAKEAGGVAQKVTQTGMVVGTPEYMSPEQLSGDEVDARSDQYSLALVAFNMLTGDLPFPSESTQTSMVMRLTEQPWSLADMKPDVAWPADVQAVMSRALERLPADRYQTTREFGRALHAAVATMPPPPEATPGTSMPDGPASTSSTAPVRASTTRSLAAPRRREIVLAAGIVGVLVAVVVGVLLARGGFGGERSSSRAYEAGIAAFGAGRRDVAAERFRRATLDAPGDPMPHVYLSRLARDRGDFSTANAEALRAVQLGPSNAMALRELASISYVQKNYASARTFYTRALAADPGDRLSRGFLGCALIKLGRAEEGARWIQRAGPGAWSNCIVR
ncbi:MAG: protein kinase [Gemmatimonadaceae bacterium]|nr:protein kinase [Gemmatimonadaceae bacterium]